VAASNTPAARFDYLTIGLSGGGRPQIRTAGGAVGIDVAFPLGQWTHVAVSLDYRNAAASRSALSVDPPITACWWTNGFYRGAVVLPLSYPLGRCDLCVGGEVVTPSTRTSYGNNLNGIVGSVRVREGMWSEQGTTSNPPNGFVPSKILDWDNDVSFQLAGPLAAGVTRGNVTEVAGEVPAADRNSVGDVVQFANLPYYASSLAAFWGIGHKKGALFRTGLGFDEVRVLMQGALSTYPLSTSSVKNFFLYPFEVPIAVAYSVEAWVKLDVAAEHIILEWKASGYNGLRIVVKSDGMLSVRQTDAAGTTVLNSVTATNNALSVGSWTHVCFQFNAATKAIELYVGGSRCTVLTTYNAATSSTFFANIRYTNMVIGNDSANGANALRGSLHDLRVTAGKQYDGAFVPRAALSPPEGPVAFWLGMFATDKASVEPLVKQGTPVESNYTYAL
jgi:hypothetical protein